MDLKSLSKQRAVLDLLPFVYNLVIVFHYFLPESMLVVYQNLFGFSLIVLIDLYYRSKQNRYCIWHRIPIYNGILICLFNSADYIWDVTFGCRLSEMADYKILFIVYGVFEVLFVVSAIMFLKERFKKDIKRCRD